MKYSFLIIIIMFFVACNEQETLEPNPDVDLKIKEVIPPYPQIGDRMKIILSREFRKNERNWHLFFDDNWSDVDSVKKDTIYAFLPYIKNNSITELKILINLENQSVGLTKLIEINNTCKTGICVVKNDEGKVTEKDIYPLDMMGNPLNWEISSEDDTITISSYRRSADEANETFILKFLKDTSGELPDFINFTRIKNESNGAPPVITSYDTLKNGVIKIDDWNNGGVYSGIIYAELEPFESRKYFLPRTVFWLTE